MGYDGCMVVFKKKTLEEFKEYIKDFSFKDLYLCFLTDSLEDQDRPVWYIETNKDVFTGFFGKEFTSEHAMIVDKETYKKYNNWIEKQLSDFSILDVAVNELKNHYMDWEYFKYAIAIYNKMKSNPIDFDNEFVVIEHDW